MFKTILDFKTHNFLENLFCFNHKAISIDYNNLETKIPARKRLKFWISL